MSCQGGIDTRIVYILRFAAFYEISFRILPLKQKPLTAVSQSAMYVEDAKATNELCTAAAYGKRFVAAEIYAVLTLASTIPPATCATN